MALRVMLLLYVDLNAVREQLANLEDCQTIYI